jgi:hypothetical protein
LVGQRDTPRLQEAGCALEVLVGMMDDDEGGKDIGKKVDVATGMLGSDHVIYPAWSFQPSTEL